MFINPLDGLTNVDCNGAIATIFSIHLIKNKFQLNSALLKNRKKSSGSPKPHFMQGHQVVCSGYCLYSSSVQLVIGIDPQITETGVSLFNLDRQAQ